MVTALIKETYFNYTTKGDKMPTETHITRDAPTRRTYPRATKELVYLNAVGGQARYGRPQICASGRLVAMSTEKRGIVTKRDAN